MLRLFAVISSLLMALPALAQQNKTLDGKPPLVIGHRGASGYLPEHTLEAYRLAIAQGADFIEPDLVVTKDGVLVARHEPIIGATTDVADRPEFANRKTTRKLDGIETTDWWVSDFTLTELKTLRAKQAMKERDQSHNGNYAIPTLQEIIDLAKSESAQLGRTIGIYPETKHPTFHFSLGLPIEDRLLDMLAKAGWTDASAPVFIQSFEVGNLKYLRGKMRVRLVQLIDGDGVDAGGNVTLAPPVDKPYDFVVIGDKRTYKDLVTPAGLAEIKTYANGIGPWKPYILPTASVMQDGKPVDVNGDGAFDERDRQVARPSDLVAEAHRAGLIVHAFTFRAEPRRLAGDFKGEPAGEYNAFFALGVDGVFSDFPDHAVKARGTR